MQKLAILVTRLSSWVLSKMGRGGSMPGRLGIKIAPDCLNHLKFGGPVILVTGTNGKTSTANMVSDLMEEAGYKVGSDVAFAMDAAASELYNDETGKYIFEGEGRLKGSPVVRSADEMIAYYKKLTEKYPLRSIEDGLDEEDWEGWVHMTRELGDRVQLVGEDLFVTNLSLIHI